MLVRIASRIRAAEVVASSTSTSSPSRAMTTSKVNGAPNSKAAPAVSRQVIPRNRRGSAAMPLATREIPKNRATIDSTSHESTAARSKSAPTEMKKIGTKKPKPMDDILVSRMPFSRKTNENRAPATKAPRIASTPIIAASATKTSIIAMPARTPISEGSRAATTRANMRGRHQIQVRSTTSTR